MQGEHLATMMATTMDKMMQERENTTGLNQAIEMVIGTTGRFNGKDVSPYLEMYKVEMLILKMIAKSHN